MSKKPLNNSVHANTDLVLAEGLLKHFPFPSVKTVSNLRRRKVIPAIRLGYRSYVFSIKAVAAALARLEIKEIGRPK